MQSPCAWLKATDKESSKILRQVMRRQAIGFAQAAGEHPEVVQALKALYKEKYGCEWSNQGECCPIIPS